VIAVLCVDDEPALLRIAQIFLEETGLYTVDTALSAEEAKAKIAEKERIFERGYGKNTGLGLFIAREILAISGIGIVENGRYLRGARFEIIVPKGGYRWTKTA